jgi:circadian clock protein KaiB
VETVELVLYISGHAPSSQRARQTLSRVTGTFAEGQINVSFSDVTQEPLRAEGDGVLFTPTLVKVRPMPRAWIVGDLADGAALTALLHASGLEEPR